MATNFLTFSADMQDAARWTLFILGHVECCRICIQIPATCYNVSISSMLQSGCLIKEYRIASLREPSTSATVADILLTGKSVWFASK